MKLPKPGKIPRVAVTALALTWAGGCAPGPAPAPPAPSPIILFSFDTLRADHLTCYGYPKNTSPAIAAFSQDAVLFENPLSQAALTAPGHMSIFTALTPAVHGVNNPNDVQPDFFNPLPEGIPTLPSLLKDRGYFTVGITGGGTVSAEFGFDRGFDDYGNAFAFNFQTVYFQPEGVLSDIRQRLRESREGKRPIFLFLHHYLCHHPYVQSPPEFTLRFLEKPVPGLPVDRAGLLKNADPAWGIYDENSFWRNIDLSRPDHRGHVVGLYDGSIAYADYIFGRLVEILKEEGLYEDALVILTSDHGEEFYEHGGKQHERLFIEQLRVPLVIKFPGRQQAGKRIGATVRTMDILPTLCEYLDVPLPALIQGVSLMPLVSGRGSYDPAIASYGLIYRGPDTGEMDTKVRVAKGGYVYSNYPWSGQTEWLFDAATDPREQRNLAQERPEILARMRNTGARELARDLRLRTKLVPGKESAQPLSQNLKKQLKALGYLQ